MAEIGREEASTRTPPYMAFSTFRTFLQNIKPHKLPGRIDRSLLGQFSGSNQAQLITALRFLALIDAHGHPTENLDRLIQAFGTERWPDALGELLRGNYGPLFTIDLASASPAQFNERFRGAFQGSEEVMRKSTTFFLNAAREAGIEISPHIMKNKKPRGAGGGQRRRSARSPGTAQARPSTPVDPTPAATASAVGNGRAAPKPPSSFELLAAFDPSDMSEDEQKAVWTLIQYLRRKEVVARSGEQRRQKSSRTSAASAAAEPKEA